MPRARASSIWDDVLRHLEGISFLRECFVGDERRYEVGSRACEEAAVSSSMRLPCSMERTPDWRQFLTLLSL